jgi:hypothetical protein
MTDLAAQDAGPLVTRCCEVWNQLVIPASLAV